MKINFFFDFKKGASGGANQFLKALRNQFLAKDIYTDNPQKADIIIINSYHKMGRFIVFLLKKRSTLVVHRLGPIFSYHRGNIWKLYDRFIVQFANTFADGVIFQSHWSYAEALRLGLEQNIRSAIIHNAPDNNLFFGTQKKYSAVEDVFHIVASSNSDNWKKGFSYFQFLDKHLDFLNYKMTFVGRTPVKFRNIKHIEPQDSMGLAKILHSGDLYISPVQNEACSNAILEALSCGLPVLALDDSSNPEIVKSAGELFSNENELLEKIRKIRNDYEAYRSRIVRPDIGRVANQYESFLCGLQKKTPRKKNIIALFLYEGYRIAVVLIISIADRYTKIFPTKSI